MNLNIEDIKRKIPKRPSDANKGTFGKALIIAGSENYPGAAILSCLAAARTGVGLVSLATVEGVYKIAVPKIPFVTFLNFNQVKENIEKYDAILIGPGLGENKDSETPLSEAGLIIKEWIQLKGITDKKLVIDADGLNTLSGIEGWFKIMETNAILTPHPGEMSRLTNLSIKEIQNNREEVAKKYSKIWGKVIILKGAETVIATPLGEIFKASFANPLLATAGTGDVLSGIIVSLLAQGLNMKDASILGVYIHGLAGEKLKEKFGDRGATASDLIEVLPEVFKSLRSF